MKTQIPKIEDEIDSKKEGSSKYSFYTLIVFYYRSHFLFRIIGDTLDFQ